MLSPPTLTSHPDRADAAHRPDGVTVLGVQFTSIKSLFAPLVDHADLMLIHVNDWLNELRYKFRRGAFVKVEPLSGTDWREWRLPPGWTNRGASWVMPRLVKRIERAWRERGWSNPRLVVTFPYFLPLARAVGPERLTYYAVDNYQAYWPDRATALYEQENELIEIAGASIVASSLLADWFRERVPSAAAKIHYLPNGVRPDMIPPPETMRAHSLALEDNLAQCFGEANGPVIGYYGNIGSGYGIEFLAAIVARLPNFRFLLMGQVLSEHRSPYNEAVTYLRKCRNVSMTGHLQEPESLQFLRQCDVMIIPLPLTDQIRYSCPNRLWTYMASGRPIVSTPIPEVTKFGELVYVAANLDEFVGALGRAAQEYDPGLVTKRIEIAKQHTWPVLAERMWSILSLM